MDKGLRTFLSHCSATDAGCSVDQLFARLVSRIDQLTNTPTEQADLELTLLGDLTILAVQDPEFALFAAEPVIAYLNSYEIGILEQFVVVLEELGFNIEEQDDDNQTAHIAVMCADDAYRPDAESLIGLLDEFNQISDPVAEASVAQAAICTGWPQALAP